MSRIRGVDYFSVTIVCFRKYLRCPLAIRVLRLTVTDTSKCQIKQNEKLVCFFVFRYSISEVSLFVVFRYSISEVSLFFVIRTFFQVITLKNLVWHAARSQISCSQCYNSQFTFNQRKYIYFEYQNRNFILFFVFVIRTITFYQVIMLKNLVWHAARSQISCSQCYNSQFTFNQRKYFINFEYQNRNFILFFVFRHSDNHIFFKLLCSKNLVWHAGRKCSLACRPISNIVFSML